MFSGSRLNLYLSLYWHTAFSISVFVLSGGASVAIFVLVTEFVGVHHRSMMGMSLWYCWSLSLMALAGIAYLIRDWRMLTIATAVPGLPALLGWL